MQNTNIWIFAPSFILNSFFSLMLFIKVQFLWWTPPKSVWHIKWIPLSSMTCNKHWEILKLKTMYSPLPGWTGQQVPGCKRNASTYLCNMLCQNHRIVNDQSLMQRYQSHYFLQCELCKKTKFKPYFIIFRQFLSTRIGPLFIYFFVVKQNFTWKFLRDKKSINSGKRKIHLQ